MDDTSYWNEAQSGFQFDESNVSFGVSTQSVKRNENYQLLTYDGLSEATEKQSSVDLSSHIIWPEEDKHVQSFSKKCNPLENILKDTRENAKQTAAQTVRNMILGMDYSLQNFKGKESKIELLRAAVQSHDGNAILTVVLFLKNTLKKSIFQREIGLYPDAVNTYLFYLEEDHEIDELTNMCLLLDNGEAAAMVKYNEALKMEIPDRKIKSINNCLSTHFQVNIVSEFLCTSAIEHKKILRDQVAIMDHHTAASVNEKKDYELFHELTNESHLADQSVLTTLLFCSLFYYNVNEAAFISPEYIRNTYNLSKKQFTWSAVRALTLLKNWTAMEKLFMTKNWMGGEKVKFCINVVRFLQLLSQMQAPHEVISKYVSHIENQEVKLILAKKYQCHSIVIEIFKNSKNRIALIEYKSSLSPHSVDFCTVADILNNKTIKWKN